MVSGYDWYGGIHEKLVAKPNTRHKLGLPPLAQDGAKAADPPQVPASAGGEGLAGAGSGDHPAGPAEVVAQLFLQIRLVYYLQSQEAGGHAA